MDTERLLVVCGTILLAAAALLGYVQHWHRQRPTEFARWRVVHAGGTAGAVQLIGLAAVWRYFEHGVSSTLLAIGVTAATFAFFLGPLAAALNWPKMARSLLAVGAAVALPAYVALPLVLFL
ncbi:MAG: hypothetical protein ACOY0T_30825 [Myxococcota bacterium]